MSLTTNMINGFASVFDCDGKYFFDASLHLTDMQTSDIRSASTRLVRYRSTLPMYYGCMYEKMVIELLHVPAGYV
jgi:hypothetical protein